MYKRQGLDVDDVSRRVIAFHVAGSAGVAAIVDRGVGDPESMGRGLAALGGQDLAVARSDRVTRRDGSRQLRRDRGGRWWGLAPDPELGWVLDSGPSDDPERVCATSGPAV